jgi:hypothetical protein
MTEFQPKMELYQQIIEIFDIFSHNGSNFNKKYDKNIENFKNFLRKFHFWLKFSHFWPIVSEKVCIESSIDPFLTTIGQNQ